MKNINENELDKFLDDDSLEGTDTLNKMIKKDKSIVELVDRKIIIEDGRQLLI